MIKEDDVFCIGQVLKPHGIKGELSFSFTTDIFDEKEAPFFIVETEGILVPFFIESYRFKNNTQGLVKFEHIDTEDQAKELSNSALYLPMEYYQEEEEQLDIHYFSGFSVIDNVLGDLGKITDVEDSTENILFIVDHKGEELLIPATDDFITEIDEEKRLIKMNLPEGLVDLTLAVEE